MLQLVGKAAEVAHLHPPELLRAVQLTPCPPDRRDDRGLIAAAARRSSRRPGDNLADVQPLRRGLDPCHHAPLTAPGFGSP